MTRTQHITQTATSGAFSPLARLGNVVAKSSVLYVLLQMAVLSNALVAGVYLAFSDKISGTLL